MSPELYVGIATALLGAPTAVLAWSINRNVKSIDGRLGAVETDMRQLAGRVGTHGESLAAGNARFGSIEERVKNNEERLRDLERDCAACQRRGIAP